MLQNPMLVREVQCHFSGCYGQQRRKLALISKLTLEVEAGRGLGLAPYKHREAPD